MKHCKNIKNASGGEVKLLSIGVINRCVGVKASIDTQAHRFCTNLQNLLFIYCVINLVVILGRSIYCTNLLWQPVYNT